MWFDLITTSYTKTSVDEFAFAKAMANDKSF
jgi:hypothetical protein